MARASANRDQITLQHHAEDQAGHDREIVGIILPLDISAAKRHLGWEPRFSLPAAFADFLVELKAARG
jgi:nucleoside-diphosphate-sugar epimerase